MHSLTATPRRTHAPHRFALLMGLYSENHRKIERLLAPARLTPGTHVSTGDDGLVLQVEVLEQHRYTTELRMSYTVRDPVTGLPDPSAHVRVYRDARQAEATHCHLGRRWQDVVGMYPPPAALISHRLRMNIFLGKWLDLLALRGHGVATLQPALDNAETPV